MVANVRVRSFMRYLNRVRPNCFRNNMDKRYLMDLDDFLLLNADRTSVLALERVVPCHLENVLSLHLPSNLYNR